jgi:hypothetical protein
MTADLRRIAEAATPGPWHVDTANGVIPPDNGEAVCYPLRDKRVLADATHIAAWHPARALAALDVIEAAADGVHVCSTEDGEPCAMCAALAAWRKIREG